jgi:N-methylhydantoinase B
MPVEASEAIAPVIFWRKEFREDSGGAGTYRGGLGQVIEIGGADGIPFDVLAMFERVNTAPHGRAGGADGATGQVLLASGADLRPKGQQAIPPHDRLHLEMAGGGGFGHPYERDVERVAEDVRNHIVSVNSAREQYGVVLRDDGRVGEVATAALRGANGHP